MSAGLWTYTKCRTLDLDATPADPQAPSPPQPHTAPRGPPRPSAPHGSTRPSALGPQLHTALGGPPTPSQDRAGRKRGYLGMVERLKQMRYIALLGPPPARRIEEKK